MRERLLGIINQTSIELYRSEYDELVDALIDNGVIAPLVTVGQTVWCLIDKFNGVVDGKIYEYTIRSDGLAYFRFTRDGYFTGTAMEDAIGKTVFLTREAAEAALKARKKQ